ncbi:MAG: ISL3 family transposase [Rhodobacteraceae bacterium]|nr:ISL3 family transposase [Paracoccaceae bacterium]
MSRFSSRFEALVIDWLGEANILAVHRLLGVSWNAIDGIKQRAVARGLQRREEDELVHVCVDETSFKKRHDYVTVVSDHVGGKVIHVGEGRRKGTLDEWYKGLSQERLESIESVSMDMWPAYVNSTLKHVPDGDRKIAFDRFHVVRKLSEAVDKVRRQEHKSLQRMGMDDLKGTRYDWLINRRNMTSRQRHRFRHLRDSSLKTARAWAIRETAMSLWRYIHRGWALKGWKRWLSWAMRCRLEPMKEAARMVRKHLWGIINAVVLKVSNGPAESLNSRIKMIKVKSRGYRNRQRFITDIYFHLGGLDLYPEGVKK